MGWFDTTARSEAQIEREIAEEIEFHLEQRVRELVEQGMAEGEARIEAERRFGSPERVRAQCRSVHLGEKIMLQRVQLALNLVLVLAFVGLGIAFWRSRQSEAQTMEAMQTEVRKLSALLEPRAAQLASAVSQQEDQDPSLEPFRALTDVAGARALASELAAKDVDSGWEILLVGWPLVRDWNQRVALLEPFVINGGHAHAVDVLHLAATDPDERVRAAGFRWLRNYAWQDFAAKPASLYLEWYARVRGSGVVTILTMGVRAYQSRLAMLHGPELLREMQLLGEIDLAPGKQRDYDELNDLWCVGSGNARELTEQWLTSGDAELRLAAVRFFALFHRDPDFASTYFLGTLTQSSLPETESLIAACHALAASGRIDLEPFTEVTLRLLRACIETDTPEARIAIGSEILARLWQLPPQPVRTSADWIVWWKANRSRFFPRIPPTENETVRWLDAR